MKELFLGFLEVSLSGSLIIGVVLLLRLIFSKAPKALICLLWLLAFARLLMPFQLEANWSLRPEMPTMSASFGERADRTLEISGGETENPESQNHKDIAEEISVDYLKILSVIWVAVSGAMLVYTFGAYLRLKYQMREAIRIDERVYEVSGLGSAFLLGYFVPKIYIPMGMDADSAHLVIAHERAHIRRMDNWLKLLAFVALSLHWFNPVVWCGYILFCKDIEDACDQAVIRDLGPWGRKLYSEALLACGKRRKAMLACPVAFGEVSIRQRIRNVLNYKRPTLWISVAVVIAIVFVGVFLLVDPMQKHPPYYKELMDQLGEPRDVVCRELGLSENDMSDVTGGGYFYATSLSVEYEGVRFNIWLNFERGSELLSGFRYVAEYDGCPDEAVNAAGGIGKHLMRALGKGYQWEQRDEEEREYDFSEEAVRKGLEDPSQGRVFESWNLTKSASRHARTYLDQIQVSSSWQEAYGDMARRYRESPHFYLEYRALYQPEENKTVLTLEYLTGWQPGHYTTIVTSDYDWG